MRIAIIGMALIAAGCDRIPGTDAAEVRQAKNVIAASLLDAESARFQNVQVMKTGYICGEVNSTNQFGGYTGFQAFSYNQSSGVVEVAPNGTQGLEDIEKQNSVDENCHGKISQKESDQDNADALNAKP